MSLENEVLGSYISEFPLEKLRGRLNKNGFEDCLNISKLNNKNVKMILMVKKNKIIKTKKNELMSITTMFDEFGSVGVVIFPSLYKQVSSLLNAGCYLVIEGKVEVKENVSIVANNIKEFQIKANG